LSGSVAKKINENHHLNPVHVKGHSWPSHVLCRIQSFGCVCKRGIPPKITIWIGKMMLNQFLEGFPLNLCYPFRPHTVPHFCNCSPFFHTPQASPSDHRRALEHPCSWHLPPGVGSSWSGAAVAVKSPHCW
jgi:hypothetical protein